jgi:hypothetical protein
MITGLIFDFFGTLVEYNETRDWGDKSSSYDFLRSMLYLAYFIQIAGFY